MAYLGICSIGDAAVTIDPPPAIPMLRPRISQAFPLPE
jgi:hypothetical protein